MDEFDAAAAGAGIAKRVICVARVSADPAHVLLLIFLKIFGAIGRGTRRT